MNKHLDLLIQLLEWYWDEAENELVEKWDNLSEHSKQVMLEMYIYDKLREYM